MGYIIPKYISPIFSLQRVSGKTATYKTFVLFQDEIGEFADGRPIAESTTSGKQRKAKGQQKFQSESRS